MKKISTRIILTVLICSISMALLVGTVSMFKSLSIVERDARQKILETTKIHGGEIDNDLIKYESIVDSLHYLVESTIEMDKMRQEDYLVNYSNYILKPIAEKLTTTNLDSAGIYVAID